MIEDWSDRAWLRRAIFLGINLAAGLAIFSLVVEPIHAFLADRDAEIARQSELLARLRAVAAREADIQALARQSAAGIDRGEFLVGPNEGVASAGLQARLKTMTEGAGARLRSVQGLPARADGEVRYIGARIEIYGALGAVHRVVHAVESGKPYLLVTGAAIRLSPQINRQGGPEEPIIDAQLEIFGAFQVEGRER